MCGKALEEEDPPICRCCFNGLPRTEQCVLRGNLSEEPFRDLHNFERGASYLFYDKDSMVRPLIHKMKYAEQPQIGEYLAKEAAREFLQTDFFDDIDLIIPVPLHPKRLRERGYNQSEWIARGLSQITGIPISTTHLLRYQNNPKQAQIDPNERVKNVENIFGVNHPEELYRKHILLVDDVITTGSTLRSCIKACKPCRGAKFSVFALGKAR